MAERRSRPRKRAVTPAPVAGASLSEGPGGSAAQTLSEGLVQDILRDGSACHPLTGRALTVDDLPAGRRPA